MITGRQIREARNLLQWSLQDMADAAKVHPFVASQAEAALDQPSIADAQIEKLRGALEAAGCAFLKDDKQGSGVRLRTQDQP